MVNPLEEDRLKDFRLENFRCILRSLESVTGALATPEEERLRLSQLMTQKEKFAAQYAENISLTTLIQSVEAERNNIRNLIEQITRSNSPLGLAIQRFKLSEEDIYPKRASEMLQQGDQLILLATYHAAHLGIGSSPNKLVSLSDGGKELILKPWHIIHVLRLVPRHP